MDQSDGIPKAEAIIGENTNACVSSAKLKPKDCRADDIGPVGLQNSRLFLLIFLAALAAFGPFVTDFYLPTLPEQTTDFKTSAAMVQLGLSSTMWGLAAGQLYVGPLSDRKGRRMPLFWSLALFCAATLGAALATGIHFFLAMRFLEGLGASGAIVMSRSIAADRYAGKELGGFMAVMGAIQGIAPITAPMLGAVIAGFVGWRGIFWLLFGSSAILALVTLFKLVETRIVEKTAAKRGAPSGETMKQSFKALFSDPVFLGIVLQQIFASALLFAHISSSPFIFRSHFGLSSEAYGVFFGVLALGITAGATSSSRFRSPLVSMAAGAYGLLGLSVILLGLFLLEASLWFVAPVYFLLLASLGLTLPAAMTAALARHRARSGLAAAVLGAVGFGAGGLVAPLTTIGEASVATPAIFVVCAVVLTGVALALKRYDEAEAGGDKRKGLSRGVGEEVDLGKVDKK